MNERFKELRAEAQNLAGRKHPTGRPLNLGGAEQTPDFQIFLARIHDSYEFLAELIVKECIRIDIENPDAAPGVEIAEYFGVEK